MRIEKIVSSLFLVSVAAAGLVACSKEPTAVAVSPVAPAAAKFHLAASIQELMHDLVDPSADGVWESVGSTITAKGVEDRQPRTDAEWQAVRTHGLLLIEATNLLTMNGRRLVPVGGKVLDEEQPGVLKAAEGQQLLDAQHDTFVQFAGALRETAEKMLAAIDAKDPAAMLEIGTEMDAVCESCHTTFWYPNQVYPSASNGTTTLDDARAAAR